MRNNVIFTGVDPSAPFHIFTGKELWPFVVSIEVKGIMFLSLMTYYGKNQPYDNTKYKAVKNRNFISLYVEDGHGGFNFACYIIEMRTKGGVILREADDIYGFITT